MRVGSKAGEWFQHIYTSDVETTSFKIGGEELFHSAYLINLALTARDFRSAVKDLRSQLSLDTLTKSIRDTCGVLGAVMVRMMEAYNDSPTWMNPEHSPSLKVTINGNQDGGEGVPVFHMVDQNVANFKCSTPFGNGRAIPFKQFGRRYVSSIELLINTLIALKQLTLECSDVTVESAAKELGVQKGTKGYGIDLYYRWYTVGEIVAYINNAPKSYVSASLYGMHTDFLEDREDVDALLSDVFDGATCTSKFVEITRPRASRRGVVSDRSART